MRIKELIKEKGFTQKEFADKLGMTTVGLAQILSSGKPSYTTLEKIASVEVHEFTSFKHLDGRIGTCMSHRASPRS